MTDLEKENEKLRAERDQLRRERDAYLDFAQGWCHMYDCAWVQRPPGAPPAEHPCSCGLAERIKAVPFEYKTELDEAETKRDGERKARQQAEGYVEELQAQAAAMRACLEGLKNALVFYGRKEDHIGAIDAALAPDAGRELLKRIRDAKIALLGEDGVCVLCAEDRLLLSGVPMPGRPGETCMACVPCVLERLRRAEAKIEPLTRTALCRERDALKVQVERDGKAVQEIREDAELRMKVLREDLLALRTQRDFYADRIADLTDERDALKTHNRSLAEGERGERELRGKLENERDALKARIGAMRSAASTLMDAASSHVTGHISEKEFLDAMSGLSLAMYGDEPEKHWLHPKAAGELKARVAELEHGEGLVHAALHAAEEEVARLRGVVADLEGRLAAQNREARQ